MSSVPVTIQAIGPHDAQNHSVMLTAKLITARWNQKLENLMTLKQQLEEFADSGGLDYSPFAEALLDHPVLLIQAVEDLDDAELTALHTMIREHLVEAVTADTVVEITHPSQDAHGDPVGPPLLFNMIISHGEIPENYAGILLLDIAELFNAPVTETEMAQYVRGEANLAD